MDRKDLSLSLTVLKSDRAKGIITTIANTGNNVDRQKDNLLYGAWAKVIAESQQPAFIWNHNVKDLDIRGKVIRMEELAPGDQRVPLNRKGGKSASASALLADIQCAMETQDGRDAFALIEGGYVKEMSVQFDNRREDEEIDRDGVRNIKLVNELFEISAVLKGASYGTAVLMTKALQLAKGEVEGDPADLLRAIHELASAGGAHCKAIAVDEQSDSSTKQELPQPAEPIAEAITPNVTELTAYALAFARAYGTVVGDQI